MSSEDKAVKKTELIIKALDYAQKHELDINDRSHVKKILETFDPDHTASKDVDEFMKLLQNADTFMEMTAKKKQSEETKLPN